MMDDIKLIADDASPMYLEYVSSFLHTKQNIHRVINQKIEHHYRPLSYLFLDQLFHMFGKNYRAYHIISIVAFAIFCITAYVILRIIFGVWLVPFLAIVMFCVHPINSMTVDYIVGSSVSLYGMFILFSFLSFLLYRKYIKYVFLLFSLIFFVFSILSHEMGFLFILYLAIYLFVFERVSVRKIFFILLPFILLGIICILIRPPYVESASNLLKGFASLKLTFVSYTASIFILIKWYMLAILFLKEILFIYSINPIKTNILVINILGILALFSAIVFFFKKKKNTFLSFGSILFLLGFLPLGIACFSITDLGMTIEPYWFYISSLGIFIVFASFLDYLKSIINYKIWILLVIALVSTTIFYSRLYNQLFYNQESYCKYWIKILPYNKSAYYYLAASQMERGDLEDARKNFIKSKIDKFSDWEIYLNISLTYSMKQKYDKALQWLIEAEKINPRESSISNNLGIVMFNKGKVNEANKYFVDAIMKENYFLLEPRLNLAKLEQATGNIKAAMELYSNILKHIPNEKHSMYNLLRLYFRINDKKNALLISKKIIKEIKDPVIITNSAKILISQGYIKEAFNFYKRVLQIDKRAEDVYLELGKIYGNYNQFDQAINVWSMGLRINPKDERFVVLIKEAERLKSLQFKKITK